MKWQRLFLLLMVGACPIGVQAKPLAEEESYAARAQEVDEAEARPRRRYRFSRSANSEELTIEPVEERAAALHYRVRIDDADEDDDCGCHGKSNGSDFGR